MSYIMVDIEADGPIPGDYSITGEALRSSDTKVFERSRPAGVVLLCAKTFVWALRRNSRIDY